MAIQNYKELKAAIADWMDRQQLVNTVPSEIEGVNIDLANVFCTRVEGDINRSVRVEDMIVPMFNAPVENQSMVVLPDNVLGIRLVLVDGVDAVYLTPEQLSMGENYYSGIPLYTRVARQLHFYPPLAEGCQITVLPYVTLKPLVNDTDTNWMLTKYPDVYLNGCLYEACRYVRDDEGAMMWKGDYVQALGAIIDSDLDDRWSGSTMSVHNA